MARMVVVVVMGFLPVLLSVLSTFNKSSLILSFILRPPSTWPDVVPSPRVAVTPVARRYGREASQGDPTLTSGRRHVRVSSSQAQKGNGRLTSHI